MKTFELTATKLHNRSKTVVTRDNGKQDEEIGEASVIKDGQSQGKFLMIF